MNIIFDIDGTICFDGQKIDCEIHTQLEKLAQKHHVIFATARPIRDAIDIVKKINFENLKIIGSNGAMYYENEEIYCEMLPVKVVERLFKYVEKNTNDLGILLDYDWDYYYQGDMHPLLDRVDSQNKAKMLKTAKFNGVVKVAIVGNITPMIKNDLEEIGIDVAINFYPTENIIDFVKKDINKHSKICEILGDESYIFFGNDHNDIVALENAKIGYIVGNQITVENCKKITSENLCEVLKELSVTI